jgi:hypothetical protein
VSLEPVEESEGVSDLAASPVGSPIGTLTRDVFTHVRRGRGSRRPFATKR